MKFFDIFIESDLSSGSLKDIISSAEEMEYTGIAVAKKFENVKEFKDFKMLLESFETSLELYAVAKISAKETAEMKRLIDDAREIADIIAVEGGDYKINRAACENSKVDILIHPERGRFDSGLDDVCINAAKRNSVAIEINFRDALMSYRRIRSSILQNMMRNVRLCHEIGVPVVICSGATNKWEMRGPRELIAFGNVVGIEFNNSFSALTEIPNSILINNKKKIENKIITEGVEIV